MFRLKFPSGATLEFKHENNLEYHGTLYIWPEDIQPLLEISQAEIELQEKEKNDNQMLRQPHDRDKNS